MAEKITVEELKQTVDANYTPDTETIWHGLQLVIKKHLSFQETINFVGNVVSLCFADETDEYIPEVKDFAIRCMILEKYANFELPEDLNERFDIVYSSGLVPFVMDHIDRGHFDPMIEAIDAKVEYRAKSKVDALTKQVEEIVTGFEGLSHDMDRLFAGVDPDTMMQLTGALANGAFDENKLANAVIAANNTKESEENGDI